MHTVSWRLSVSRYTPSHFPIIRPSQYKPKVYLASATPPPLPRPSPSQQISQALFFFSLFGIPEPTSSLWQPRSNGARKTSAFRFRFRFRPYAASHSSGTKPPCWREKVALGKDKQRKLLFRIMYAFVCLVPVRLLLASRAVLYHVNG